MDRVLLLAVVASLPIMQPTILSIADYPVVLTDLLFVALAAVVFTRLVLGRMRIAWSYWHAALAAFVVTGFMSAAVAGSTHAWVKAAGTGYLACLAIFTAHYAQEPLATRRILSAWLLGTAVTLAAIAAGVALFAAGDRSNRFLYGYGSLIPGAYPRVQGLFLNANMLCSYLAASALLTLGGVRAQLTGRTVGYVLAIGAVAAAVLTFSPGLGGLVLALAWWMSSSSASGRRRALRISAVMVAIAFALVTLVSPTMLQRDAGLMGARLEPSSRVLAWRDAAATFAAHPLLGAGPGAEVAHVSYLNASHFQEQLTDAHNTVLSVLAQTGLVGFASFALVVGTLLASMRAASQDRGWRWGCELALIAALVYPSLSGSFEDTRHVWALMGLVHAAQNGISAPETDLASRP